MAGNRILYFYLVILTFIFFVLFDIYLFHLFLIFLIALPLLSLLVALPLSRFVFYRLETDDDIVPKGECRLKLSAANRSILPCARVRVVLQRSNALGRTEGRSPDSAEEVIQFSLAPRTAFTLHPETAMDFCGRVDFCIKRAYVSDILGLFSIPIPKKNELGGAGSVYVLPELQRRSIPIEDAADLGMDSASYSTEKPGGDPSEIFQLRDYREGDARHSIHWKLSGRMNRLIVREFGLPLNPSLHFLLELRADALAAEAEYMLGLTLAYAEYLMARDIVHHISWLGGDGILHTAKITGADTLATALHELLALPGQKHWSTLERFALETSHSAESHLVYLIAGAFDAPDPGGMAEQLLGSMVGRSLCRRLTLMPDRCKPKIAEEYRALGCEVQLMNGRTINAETEEAP